LHSWIGRSPGFAHLKDCDRPLTPHKGRGHSGHNWNPMSSFTADGPVSDIKNRHDSIELRKTQPMDRHPAFFWSAILAIRSQRRPEVKNCRSEKIIAPSGRLRSSSLSSVQFLSIECTGPFQQLPRAGTQATLSRGEEKKNSVCARPSEDRTSRRRAVKAFGRDLPLEQTPAICPPRPAGKTIIGGKIR